MQTPNILPITDRNFCIADHPPTARSLRGETILYPESPAFGFTVLSVHCEIGCYDPDKAGGTSSVEFSSTGVLQYRERVAVRRFFSSRMATLFLPRRLAPVA